MILPSSVNSLPILETEIFVNYNFSRCFEWRSEKGRRNFITSHYSAYVIMTMKSRRRFLKQLTQSTWKNNKKSMPLKLKFIFPRLLRPTIVDRLWSHITACGISDWPSSTGTDFFGALRAYPISIIPEMYCNQISFNWHRNLWKW